MFTYRVAVGFTTIRPVRPEQFTSLVILLADTDSEAVLVAAQMVACRTGVVMPTSSTILEVEM